MKKVHFNLNTEFGSCPRNEVRGGHYGRYADQRRKHVYDKFALLFTKLLCKNRVDLIALRYDTTRLFEYDEESPQLYLSDTSF